MHPMCRGGGTLLFQFYCKLKLPLKIKLIQNNFKKLLATDSQMKSLSLTRDNNMLKTLKAKLREYRMRPF